MPDPARRGLRRLRRVAAAWSDPPRVDFVIAGAQKAGTTYLHAALAAHPGVELAAWRASRPGD